MNKSILTDLIKNAINAINQAADLAELNDIRIKYLGRKGYLTLQIANLHELPSEEIPTTGMIINDIKEKIKHAIKVRKVELENIAINKRMARETIDVSLPGRRVENGTLHPITRTINRIESLLSKIGFTIEIGPEIEDSYHNFNALNIPDYHPARAKRDTFWFDKIRLLRTQTSGVQIRIMKNQKPPIRIISSGRVYRNDYDQTHTPMFHQMEGLIVDKNINFANLKWILRDFLYNFFEEDLQISFRPSYFPFTEPSAEIDVMGKDGKWLEVLGCGIVHPNVLRNVNINPDTYSGLAFGIGIERLTMLRYNINDIRILFENDLRFLKQFK